MIKVIALDASPLGRLVHPRLNTDIAAWIDEILKASITVHIPEIIDYEVRRGLLAAGMARSVRRLDEFKQVLEYLPLTTSVMLEAASLWAQAGNKGEALPTRKSWMEMSSWRRRPGKRAQ